MQTLETKRKYIVDFFLRKGLLINNDLLGYLGNEDNLSGVCKLIEKGHHKNIAVLNERIMDILGLEGQNLNWLELEKLGMMLEKKEAKTRTNCLSKFWEMKRIISKKKFAKSTK